jgi:bacterioferritin-associated ferredoxin
MMYVCLCNAVTDEQIRAEVKQGACTMRELRDRLGVATCCGRCSPCARAILTEIIMNAAAHRMPVAATPDLPAEA